MKKIVFYGLSALLLCILVGCATPKNNLDMEDKITNTDKTNIISKEEALSIALKDASIQKEDISNIRIEKDYDNKQISYEISFYYHNLEYEYEIDAINKTILSYDIDD